MENLATALKGICCFFDRHKNIIQRNDWVSLLDSEGKIQKSAGSETQERIFARGALQLEIAGCIFF